MNLLESSFFLAVSRISYKKKKEFLQGNLPGGPVVKTLHFQCMGHGFNPWLGNRFPHATGCGQKVKQKKTLTHFFVLVVVGLHCCLL